VAASQIIALTSIAALARIAMLWAKDAGYCVTWVAGEMKQPHRALAIGISLLTLIHLVVNICRSARRPRSGGAGVHPLSVWDFRTTSARRTHP
jgi:hypothetical protein